MTMVSTCSSRYTLDINNEKLCYIDETQWQRNSLTLDDTRVTPFLTTCFLDKPGGTRVRDRREVWSAVCSNRTVRGGVSSFPLNRTRFKNCKWPLKPSGRRQ